jgi:hypothetical protein
MANPSLSFRVACPLRASNKVAGMAYATISIVRKSQIATAASCGLTMTKIDVSPFPIIFTIFYFANNTPVVYHPKVSERNQGRTAEKSIIMLG